MAFSTRAPGVAAGLALGAAAPIAAVAYAHFTRPIGEENGLVTHAAVALTAVLVPVLAIAGLRIATASLRSRWRESIAWIAVVIGFLVCVVALARRGTIDRERALYAMPIAGELVADGPPVQLRELGVLLQTGGVSCRGVLGFLNRSEAFVPNGATDTYCPPLRVRHDAVNDIAVVESLPPWNARVPDNDASWEILAVRSTRDGSTVPLDARTLRRTVRVPRDWMGLAALSSIAASMLLIVARRLRGRAAAMASLSDADHVGDGWFAFADGRRLRAASATALAVGTFAVSITEPATEPSYRSTAAATVEPMRAGTSQSNADRVSGLGASCESLALAVATAGAMPALAALLALIL